MPHTASKAWSEKDAKEFAALLADAERMLRDAKRLVDALKAKKLVAKISGARS
jgi:hypothetical protein